MVLLRILILEIIEVIIKYLMYGRIGCFFYKFCVIWWLIKMVIFFIYVYYVYIYCIWIMKKRFGEINKILVYMCVYVGVY